MRVTDREVIEPSLEPRVFGDWEIRLITLKVKGAAMNTTDSQTFVTRGACGKRHGQIRFTSFRSTGPSIEDCILRYLVAEVVPIYDMNPLRQTAAKGMSGGPDGFRRQRVMISRNEEDWNLPDSMFANGSRQFLPKVRCGLRVIEDVSGTKDGMDSIATSHIKDARYHVHTSPRKLRLGPVRKR